MIKSLLGLFMRDVVVDAQRRVAQNESTNQLREAVRQEFLRHVTEGFSREVAHNISQYVRSVGAVEVEIGPSEGEGDRLFSALQNALVALEVELEQMGPGSPVSQYLVRKYGSEELYTGRQSQTVASMYMVTDDDNGDDPVLDSYLSSMLDRLLAQNTSNPSSDFRLPQEFAD